MLSDEEITDKASDWAIDYKPWEEDLTYRCYAKHGYIEGYKQAQRDILKKLGLTKIEKGV
jgi:hypothetical protein